MRVYRLLSRRYDPKSGEGARRVRGRWNLPEIPVVYTADSRALAVLECAVHMAELPDDYSLWAIDVPARVKTDTILEGDLPPDWRGNILTRATQEIGSRWVESGKTAVLSVPSVVIPQERNFLLNPNHRDFAKIQFALEAERFCFDKRLRPNPPPK